MRYAVATFFVFVIAFMQGATLHVSAKDYAGQTAVLYGYADYFSLRERIIEVQTVSDSGIVDFDVTLEDIELVKLKINHVVADFFIEPKGIYKIEFSKPAKGVARTINGSTKINPLFLELDRFDINALLTDLNAKIDAFTIQEYGKTKAKDQVAARQENRQAKPVDSLNVSPPSLPARIDTFEQKLLNFYSEVQHPYFKEQLHYAVAQMRITKEHPRKKLFEQYLKNKPVAHQTTEYVKFLKHFFRGHLMQEVYAKHPDALVRAIAEGKRSKVSALFETSDFLKNERLRSIVMDHELFLAWGNEKFSKKGIRTMLGEAGTGISGKARSNFLFELNAMAAGQPFPKNLDLWSPLDASTHSPSEFLTGYTYVIVTASWCSHCEQEVKALEALHKDYGAHVNFVVLAVDQQLEDYRDNSTMQPSGVKSYWAGLDPLIFDKLRLKSVPSFYFLEDDRIIQNPSLAPSAGVAREFHAIKVAAEKGERIKFWDD